MTVFLKEHQQPLMIQSCTSSCPHITCFSVLLFSVKKCFLLISRSNTTLQPNNTHMVPPKASPRYYTTIITWQQLQTTRLALHSPLFNYLAPLQTFIIITISKYYSFYQNTLDAYMHTSSVSLFWFSNNAKYLWQWQHLSHLWKHYKICLRYVFERKIDCTNKKQLKFYMFYLFTEWTSEGQQ